jgi:DNA-binding response OmpR family regulator
MLEPSCRITKPVTPNKGRRGVVGVYSWSPNGGFPVIPRIRFGVFEVDTQSGELFRQGSKVKLQDQPFQVLVLLLERPGEVVTREEIIKRLWPENTFVDFDRGLNKAINGLRGALNVGAHVKT